MISNVLLAACLIALTQGSVYQESKAEIIVSDKSPFCYCACNANVEEAKAKYEKLYDAYFEMSNVFINGTMKMIQGKVEQMNKNPYSSNFYQMDSYEMVYVLFDLCHVPALKHDFKPVWRQSPNMTPEEVCTWLSTWGRLAENRIPYNWAMIKSCAYERLFDDVILGNYRKLSGEKKCSA